MAAIKIKDSVEQITLDLFHNFDVPEEVSITFDPEVDDAVGRSRYEWLIILFAVIMREKIFEDVR